MWVCVSVCVRNKDSTCVCVCVRLLECENVHESSRDISEKPAAQCGITKKQHMETQRHTHRFMVRTTHVHSAQAKVLVLMSPHCSFYQSNTYTDSVNMEWMKGPSCQATKSGSFSPHTHTHLDNTAFIWKCHFLCFKGGSPCVCVPSVCVCVCVCVFFLDADYSRAFPYLVFPKAQLTGERAAIWPLSLSLSILCSS